MPPRDLLAQLTVQPAEILFDFAEIGEQFPGRSGELLVAVTHGGLVEQRQLTGLDPGYLLIDPLALSAQLGHPLIRIGLGTKDDLPQQFKNDVQARFGADELPFAQALDPLQRLLYGRCGVKMRLIGAVGIVLAQPAHPRCGPIVEVSPR